MARRFAALAVLALSGLAIPAVASANPTQQATLPVAFTAWTPCPEDGGEPVAWQGVMHTTYSLTANAAGGFREHFHADIHLDGVGLTTGDRYVANGASSVGETTPAAGISIVSDVQHFHSIHTGEASSADDYAIRILLRPGGAFLEQEGCH